MVILAGTRRGVTVVELLIVMSLMSVLLSLVALYFRQARHYTSETETYARVQRQANRTLRRITSDLYLGTKNFSQVYGDSMYFPSSDALNEGDPPIEFSPLSGRVMWKSWVGYFLEPSESALYRVQIPFNSPISEPTQSPLPAVDPIAFRAPEVASRSPVAKNISAFEVTRAGSIFFFRVSARDLSPVPRASEADKVVEVTVETQVQLIN